VHETGRHRGANRRICCCADARPWERGHRARGRAAAERDGGGDDAGGVSTGPEAATQTRGPSIVAQPRHASHHALLTLSLSAPARPSPSGMANVAARVEGEEEGVRAPCCRTAAVRWARLWPNGPWPRRRVAEDEWKRTAPASIETLAATYW